MDLKSIGVTRVGSNPTAVEPFGSRGGTHECDVARALFHLLLPPKRYKLYACSTQTPNTHAAYTQPVPVSVSVSRRHDCVHARTHNTDAPTHRRAVGQTHRGTRTSVGTYVCVRVWWCEARRAYCVDDEMRACGVCACRQSCEGGVWRCVEVLWRVGSGLVCVGLRVWVVVCVLNFA